MNLCIASNATHLGNYFFLLVYDYECVRFWLDEGEGLLDGVWGGLTVKGITSEST